jgi:hypothetical protein
VQQRDYILRLIEMAGAVLREALRRVLGGAASEDEVHEAIGLAGARVGIDARIALLATPETLEMMVAPTGEVDLTRCWVLAESLFVAGAHAEAAGDPALGRQYFEKARRLFILLDPSLVVVGLPEAAERVREIDRRLSASDGPDSAA